MKIKFWIIFSKNFATTFPYNKLCGPVWSEDEESLNSLWRYYLFFSNRFIWLVKEKNIKLFLNIDWLILIPV